MTPLMNQAKALFLDRDGTIIFDKHYLSDPNAVELMPGVAEALRRAQDLDFLLFLLTNQSGIGRGYHTLEDAHACNRKMLDLMGLPEPGFTEICIAPETPEQPAVYRKPSPRFILEMTEKYRLDPAQCYMVGDRLCDLQAGLNAGIQPAVISAENNLSDEMQALVSKNQVPVYQNLKAFVDSL